MFRLLSEHDRVIEEAQAVGYLHSDLFGNFSDDNLMCDAPDRYAAPRTSSRMIDMISNARSEGSAIFIDDDDPQDLGTHLRVSSLLAVQTLSNARILMNLDRTIEARGHAVECFERAAKWRNKNDIGMPVFLDESLGLFTSLLLPAFVQTTIMAIVIIATIVRVPQVDQHLGLSIRRWFRRP